MLWLAVGLGGQARQGGVGCWQVEVTIASFKDKLDQIDELL